MVGLAATLVGAVVDAVAPGQEAEAADLLDLAVEGGHALRVPAERAGAEAGQDDPGSPRLGEQRVEPVRAPGAQQAEHAAAADVDQVLGEQMGAQVADAAVAAEERDVRRLADAAGERPVEAHDVVIGVTAGGREEADARSFAPPASQSEDVLVEQRVARLHREAAAAEGDDLAVVPRGELEDVGLVHLTAPPPRVARVPAPISAIGAGSSPCWRNSLRAGVSRRREPRIPRATAGRRRPPRPCGSGSPPRPGGRRSSRHRSIRSSRA